MRRVLEGILVGSLGACWMCFVFLSCGYSGEPGYGGTLKCHEYCQKNEECCDLDPDCYTWEESDRQDCLMNCDVMNRTATNEFLVGMGECSDISCDQAQAREDCLLALIATCVSGVTDQVTRICNKQSECLDVTFLQCTNLLTQAVGCYNQKAMNAMVKCSEQTPCETWNEDYELCLEKEIGVTL